MNTGKKIFLTVFLYSVILSVAIQFVILPHFAPQLHAGNGLMKGYDWVTYHKDTVNLVHRISQQGWKAWSLRPLGQVETGLLAFFYYFIAPAPWVLIPFNAFVHASCCVLILLILKGLFPLGGIRSWLAIAPYAFFPTSLLWTTQIHKDGVAFLSSFLVLLGIKQSSEYFFDSDLSPLCFLKAISKVLLGFLMGWVVRPYVSDIYVVIFFLFGFALFVCAAFAYLFKRSIIPLSRMSVPFVFASFVLFVPGLIKVDKFFSVPPPKAAPPTVFSETESKPKPSFEPEDPPISSFFPSEIEQEKARLASPATTPTEADWQNSGWLPTVLENRLYTVSRIRIGYASTVANSNIDTAIQFHKASTMFRYLPRALQIALFAPFQSFFRSAERRGEMNFTKRLVQFEMSVIYFYLVFVFWAFFKCLRKFSWWIVLVFNGCFLIVYAFTVVNLGTFHRFRYGYICLLLAAGAPYMVEAAIALKTLYVRFFKVQNAGAVQEPASQSI